MKLEDALAILAYYQQNQLKGDWNKHIELAAMLVVSEHAKQAINQYVAEQKK